MTAPHNHALYQQDLVQRYTNIYLEKESVESGEDKDAFCLAKSYFHLKEYDRAAFFSKPLTSHKGKYMFGLKKSWQL